MRSYGCALGLLASLGACATPEHEPLNMEIAGTVINVGDPTGIFDGEGAGAIADIVDIGVIFLGTDIPPMGSGPVTEEGTFVAREVDVALAGIDSPLLAIVDDRETVTGPACDGVRFGSLFPTLSGVAGGRPKNEKDLEDITDAMVFAVPSIIARLIVSVAAESSGQVDADTLQCERGFIIGFVADLSSGEVSMIEGATVRPPDVVEEIVYLKAQGGLFAPADTSETSELGVFIAWYSEDFMASSTTNLDNFVFTADGPAGRYTGFGLAIPRMAMVAALLPEGQGF